MAVQSSFYFTDGSTRTFPSTKHIATQQHCAVYLQSVSTGLWMIADISEYDLVNQSIVFTVAPDSSLYSQIQVRVADTADELENSPSDIAVVAGISEEIVAVADNTVNINTVSLNINAVNSVSGSIANLNTVADSIVNVNNVGGSIVNVNSVAENASNINTVASDLLEPVSEINTVATDIANVNVVGSAITNVNTVSTNIANINTVATNMANVNTIASISGNITTVAGISTNVTTVANNNANVTTVAGISSNITTVAGISSAVSTVSANNLKVTTVADDIDSINSVATTIVPNIAEILLADTNAAITTTKAEEASASATSAYNSMLEATAVVTEPFKMAIGNINSPLLDMSLKNSLAMKAGVGSATFTRASTATYIDRYGVLKTAAIDEARFEKEGYLNEGASTNLLLYSGFFESSWTNSVVALVKTLNAIDDPYGNANSATTLTALTSTTSSQRYINQIVTTVAGNVYTHSWFIKNVSNVHSIQLWADSDTLTPLIYNLQTDTLTSSSANYGRELLSNGWVRVWHQFTALDTSTICRIYLYDEDGDRVATPTVDIVLGVYGAQIEALPFATSYIPTTTTAVTRAADSLIVTGLGNVPDLRLGHTAIIDMDFFGDLTADQYVFNYVGAGGIRFAGADPVGILKWVRLGTTIGGVNPSMPIVPNTRTRIALSGLDYSAMSYINGVNQTTSTTATFSFPTGDIYIGLSSNLLSRLYGHISNFRIYDKVLSSQEVALA